MNNTALKLSANQLPLKKLLKWLTGITKPVHKPLLFSALMRVINLCLDVTLFALAAAFTVDMAIARNWEWQKLLILVIIAIFKATASYLEQFSGHYVAFKALELLRTAVFSKLWPKAPQVMNSSRSGDLLASLTRDIDRIEVVYAHTFAPVVASIAVPAIMFSIGGYMVGVEILLFPAIFVLLSQFIVPFIGVRSAFRATAETLRHRRDLAHHLTDTLGGYYEVLGYGQLAQRLEQQNQIDNRIALSANRARRMLAIRRAINILLMLLTLIAIVIVGVTHHYQPVIVAALLGGALRIFEAPRGTEDATGYLDHSLAAARRLWEICHLPCSVVDGPEKLDPDAPAKVVFNNVSFGYPAIEENIRTFGVQGISFEMEPGSHTVMVGSSGSGKSTIAKLLLRYYDPSSGQITLDGQPLASFELDSLRRQVVMVAQKNQLLKATIAQNLMLGTGPVEEARLWQVLEDVGLEHEIKALPQQLQTRVGERGDNLSGGQIQRLCLARALLMAPKILVLDEFTANLNPDLEVLIRDNLAARYPRMTILEITHQLRESHRSLQVLEISNGRLIRSEC